MKKLLNIISKNYGNTSNNMNYNNRTKFLELTKEVDAEDSTTTWNNILSVHSIYGKCDPTKKATVHDGSVPKTSNHVRFVCISDTHGKHRKINLPEGDVLLHAGDITNVGEPHQLEDFAEWLSKLHYTQKVVIAGNHDLTIDKPYFKNKENYSHIVRNPRILSLGDDDDKMASTKHEMISDRARKTLCEASNTNFTYLEDESVTVLGGYKIYGSPWQPEFYNWAFNLKRGEECFKMWEKIPLDTDILITHGPPIGHGDKCISGHNAGCVDLLARVVDHVKPLFHVFGHIHEGYGATTNGTTTFVNASTCTLSYKPDNSPLVFDLPIRNSH